MSWVAELVDCSGYLPEKTMTNQELAVAYGIETGDSWIIPRTGIRKRHIAAPTEMVSHMSIAAIERLLKRAAIRREDVDLLIVATTTPDAAFPATACLIQGQCGFTSAACFDMQAACTGFVYALIVATKFLQSGSHKTAIVVGADKLSELVNKKDRSTCILFGDGAGAALLQGKGADGDSGSRIIDSVLYSDGSMADILAVSAGYNDQNALPGKGYIVMSGQQVFRQAIGKMSEMINELLARNGYTISDLDAIVPHQANIRILDAVTQKLGIKQEKMIVTVDQHANTSAASVPLALSVAINDKRIKKGSLVILEAIGAGLTWAAVLMRF